MSIKDLKQKLKELIDNTNDEELLNLMQEDAALYVTAKQKDITDGLTEEELKELKELAEEGSDKDTESLEEFKKAMRKWRTK